MHQCPGTLLQEKRPGVGLELSPLRQQRRLLVLTGLIFQNPQISADYFQFRGTNVGIKSFQGKINLFQNPTESGIPAGIPEGRTHDMVFCTHTFTHKTHKKAGVNDGILLLLQPLTTSRYAMLPQLLSLLDQRK